MDLLAWTDVVIRRGTPLLAAVLATLGLLWMLDIVGPQTAVPATPQVAAPAPRTAVVPTPVSARATSPLRVRESAGFVRNLRLGMSRAQVEALLGERLVPIQEASPGSRRFEVLAPVAGLRIGGKHQTVDTIAITTAGDGRRYHTAEGLGIGDRASAIPRAYLWAHKVCGREWYITRGKYTLRFTAQRRVTAITLTSRRAPTYVDCT